MSDFSVSERFDWLWRLFIAHSFTIAVLVFSLVSFSIPYAGQIKPYFLLMVVYYWAIYRPGLVPPLLVLTLGFVHDLIAGQPVVGITAFTLLAVQVVVRDQRLFLMSQPFIMIWLGFALTIILTSILEWILFSLFTLRLTSLMPYAAEGVLSAFLFPVIAMILGLIHRLLAASAKNF